jgi:hypothetical protein
MKALKTVGIAVFVAAVTATSVVVYVDHKVNQMTEAVMAPIESVTDTVNETVVTVEESVATTVDAVDSTLDESAAQLVDRAASTRDDLAHEWNNAKGFKSKVGAWLRSLRQ